MTILEALATGLPMKRPGWSSPLVFDQHQTAHVFTKDQLIAADWETVSEKYIDLTETEIRSAMSASADTNHVVKALGF